MQKRRLTNNDGFTLVEMLIAMVLFIIVMMITTDIFDRMLPKTKSISKSEESNIEGIVGLEMFRRDLEQAGFGLFTDIDSPPPTYTEADSAPQSAYNDAPNGIPRAIVSSDNLGANVLPGTDVLVIKATNASLSPASQCWTSINGSGSPSKIWGVNDLQENRNGKNDQVIVVSQSYKNGELLRKLIYDTTTPTILSVAYKADGSYAAPFMPSSSDKQYYYYGIDSVVSKTPFNRTDYFVKRVAGDVPASCSPAAGVLYKSVMKQDGSMQDIPVMDCVANMQVVFGWNTGGDPAGNAVDTWTDAAGKLPTGTLNTADLLLLDPKEIRTRLKLIKVYILAQDGGYDKNYSNTNTALRVGEAGETGVIGPENFFDLTTPDRLHYRWKLHRLVVRPKNLN